MGDNEELGEPRQIRNSSIARDSVGSLKSNETSASKNLATTSPGSETPVKVLLRNKTPKDSPNTKYLSVIDLYGYDDSAVASPQQSNFLHIDPNASNNNNNAGNSNSNSNSNSINNKESLYSPTSITSFNFVSKPFNDSHEDLSTARINNIFQSQNGGTTSNDQGIRKTHKKQETLYFSPRSSFEELTQSQNLMDVDDSSVFEKMSAKSEGELKKFDSSSQSQLHEHLQVQNPIQPQQHKSPQLIKSASQLHVKQTVPQHPTVYKAQSIQNLQSTRTSAMSKQQKPVSYAITPSLRESDGGNTVKNFLTNNQSLLSFQTTKSSSNRSKLLKVEISNSGSILNSERDRYGFKKKTSYISEKEYNDWWVEYEPYLIRRKKKWVALLQQNGLTIDNDNPVRFPAKSNKLKRYVRKGIPAEWRGNAWWFFARGDERLNENVGLYDELIEDIENFKPQDAEIIERDLNRTFPDNIYFRNATSNEEETPLIQSLRRVLIAFARYQPHIGYCQSLNFLAGMLLIFLDEERSFWMLVIITQKLLPGVHDLNLEGVNIDQGVLMLCIKEYLPKIWQKIGFNFDSNTNDGRQNLNNEVNVVTKLPPITLCTASWFMSAYIGILPIETCLRVWDCFFYEESKVFFRIGMSIFKLAEPLILQIRDEMEVFQIVQNFPKKLINPKELFDCCFKKRNGFLNLTQDEINRCRKFVKEQRIKASLKQLNKYDHGQDQSKNNTRPNKFFTTTGDGDNEDSNENSENNAQEELKRFKNQLDENYIPEEYDFKKNSLAGVHWNNHLLKKLHKKRVDKS